MHEFFMSVAEEAIKTVSNDYNVVLVKRNNDFVRWEITAKSNYHEYVVEYKMGEYHIFCLDGHWDCRCSFEGNGICIKEAVYNGKRVKAKSRLKIFEQTAMHMWALKQSKKI